MAVAVSRVAACVQWETRRRVAAAAAMLLPLRLHTCAVSKKASVALCREILGTAVKWPNKDADQVVLLHRLLPELCRIHDAVAGALRRLLHMHA